MNGTHDVVVVGGGLAGLAATILLAQSGRRVALIEKKQYPFHKVCGEYISNETLPFMQRLGVDLDALGVSRITRLQVTAPGGYSLHAPLPLGGYGISRYTLDHHLYKTALASGAEVHTGLRVQAIKAEGEQFAVQLDTGLTFTTGLVVGAYGKRESLDKQLNRQFMQARTGYVGVKYHVRLDFPPDLIALHNFTGGYCGISRIEEGRYCLCYLARREPLRALGSISALEAQVVRKNEHLDAIWREAEFLYDKPEVINEISFAPKQAVEQHIWMCGDAAGLITPLCGNGMSMALHGAKILTDVITTSNTFLDGKLPDAHTRAALEAEYARRWRRQFALRLWAGRRIQQLMGGTATTRVALAVLGSSPALLRNVIQLTHGKPFS